MSNTSSTSPSRPAGESHDAPASASPYGLLAGLDLAALRQKIEHPGVAPLFERMRRQWRLAHERMEQAAPEEYGYAALAWRSVTPAVVEAGLEHALTGDADALAYVERCVDELARAWAPVDPNAPGGGASIAQRPPVQSHDEMSLATDLCAGSLSAQARDNFTRIARENIIDCHRAPAALTGYGAGGNIALAQSLGAATCALVWGERCGHPDWRRVVDLGRDSVRMYLRWGMDRAGHSYETVGYGHNVLHHLYLTAYLLRQRNWCDLFASEPGLENAPDASRAIMFPDRSVLVSIGDHGLLDPWTMHHLLLTARYYNRPDHLALWYAFQGPDHPTRPFGDFGDWFEANVPDDVKRVRWSFPTLALTLLWWDPDASCPPFEATGTSTRHYSPGTETCAWRTSWSTDAVWLNLLGSGRSHASLTHSHADAGHVSLFAHGSFLAVDTGRYNVNEDQHNVVLVEKVNTYDNGEGLSMSKREGRVTRFESGGWVDYAVVDMARQKDARWADRHVLFVRMGGDDAYVVTLDNINKDDQPHTYLWQLHTAPEGEIEITGDRHAVVRGDTARLDMTFVPPSPQDFPQSPHTLALRSDTAYWSFGKDKGPVLHKETGLWTTSYSRPRLLAEMSGLNGVLMAVWSPRREGQAALKTADRSVPRVQVVDIERPDGGRDTVYAALDHAYIDIADLRAVSEVVVVRRDASGAVADVWASGALPERLS